MKLLLIPVLRHMHHDANTAALVNKLCLNLLPQYPAESFVVASLDTLTQLSTRTLAGVPEQVSLLLRFLHDFRGQVLKSLKMLADKHCVHAWPKESKERKKDPSEQFLYLTIIFKVSHCTLTCRRFLDEHQPAIIELCTACLCLNNYITASQAMAVLAALVKHSSTSIVYKQNFIDIMEVANLHMEGVLFSTVGNREHMKYLQKLLSCGIRMSDVDSEFGTQFVIMITDLLSDDVKFPSSNTEMMCDALVALSSNFQLQKYSFTQNDDSAMDAY